MKKLMAIILAVTLMLTMANIAVLAVAGPEVSFTATNVSRSAASIYKGDVFKLSVILKNADTFGGATVAFTYNSSVVAPCNAAGEVKSAWDAGILAEPLDPTNFMELMPYIEGNKLVYTKAMGLMAPAKVSITSPYTVIVLYFKAIEVGNMDIAFADADSEIYLDSALPKVAVTAPASTLAVPDLPQAPVATNVTVPAEIRDGALIAGSYTWTDPNKNDVEGASTFAWYLDGEKIDGQTSKTITIVPTYVGKNLEFEVTPKSNNLDDPASVAVKSSAVLVKAKADYKPTATVSITGTAKVGKELTASYALDNTYAVEEDLSTIAWYVVDSEEYTELGEPVSLTSTYKPVKEDVDKFAVAVVTVKVKVAGEELNAAATATATTSAIEKATPKGGNIQIGGATLPAVDGSTPTPTPTATTSPSPSPSASPNPGIEKFKDVPKANYSWAVDAIDALAKDGIIKGITEDKFEPETKTTKAQLVAMIMRALNLVDDSATTTLVKADYWGFKEIASAKKLGVIDFYGDKFDVDSVISREDMATVIAGAAKAAGITFAAKDEAEDFKDASSISSYATVAIKALQQAGIINGMGDGTFAPKGETTRAQAAKVIDAVRKLK